MKDDKVALLTVADVTDQLNVSKDYVYRKIADKELLAVRLGRALRVKPQDLQSYIEMNRG